jgi:hypothetical protein
MTALVINDLPIGKDLDRAAMASITGGHGHGKKKRARRVVRQSNEVYGNVTGSVVGNFNDIEGDITITITNHS